MAASRIACFFAFLAAAGEAHVAHVQHRSSIKHKPKNSHAAAGTHNLETLKQVPAENVSTAKILAPVDYSSGFTNKTDALDLLDLIYQGHSKAPFWKIKGYTAAVHEALDNGIGDEDRQAVLYGEIIPSTFVKMLQHIGAKPGQQFVDLGSGTGKAVFAAWIVGLNATGVEIVNERWQVACDMTQRLQKIGFRKPANGPGVTFVHSNFMGTDFSNADIIFINSNMLSKSMMEQLALQKHSGMKPGAKVVSIHGLPGDGFQFKENFIGPTSWNLNTEWTVQTVTALAKTSSSDPAAPTEDKASDSNPKVGTDAGATNSDSSVLTPPTEVKVLDSNSKAGTGGGGNIIRKETKVTPAQIAPVTGQLLGDRVKPQHNVEILQLKAAETCNMEEGKTSPDAHQLLQRGAFKVLSANGKKKVGHH